MPQRMKKCWEAIIRLPKQFRKFNATCSPGLAEIRKWLGEVKLAWLISLLWFNFVLTCVWLALHSHAWWFWIQLNPLAKSLTFWWVGGHYKVFLHNWIKFTHPEDDSKQSRLCSCGSFNPQRVHLRRKCFPSLFSVCPHILITSSLAEVVIHLF